MHRLHPHSEVFEDDGPAARRWVEAHLDADRPRPPERPWVLISMVASLDGATTLAGLSGGLGNERDRELFRGVRALADLVMVGAGTARAERYGPPSKPGQRIAVVSRSGDLSGLDTLLASGRVLAIMPDDGPDVDLPTVRAGRGSVDVAAVLAQLPDHLVVCEGGPSLNGELVAAGVVDELCLTIAARLVGGYSKRVVTGPERPIDLQLASVFEEDGYLFTRYRRRPPAHGRTRR